MPPPTAKNVVHDLTDAEFAELDALLERTPAPLEPLDAVMLDGYLCGILVQPVLLETAAWLPHVFDFESTPLPDTVNTAWQQRTNALILRRYRALNHALAEEGWFDPLVFELDPDAAPAPADAPIDPISQPLMPWVAGFQHAALCFPDLMELPDDDVMDALARLWRHLPAETPEEREVLATLQRELPLATLDDAIEDLVATVAELYELTREARYQVDTVQRDAPKVGRNAPCPCGSGKKFKQCHGAA